MPERLPAAAARPAPGQSGGRLVSLPNGLGLLRIAATAVIVALVLSPFPGGGLLAFVLFAAAGISDILDGRIARARGSVTRLGVFMDLTADKVLVAGVMIALVEVGLLATWLAALLIVREFVVQGVRAVAAASHLVMPARRLGKGKTFATLAGIGFLLMSYDAATAGPLSRVAGSQQALAGVGFWLMVVALVLSALSAALYLRAAWPVLTGDGGEEASGKQRPLLDDPLLKPERGDGEPSHE